MIETTTIRSFEALAQLRPEWAQLHREAQPGTPFEHPAWAETWAQRFVAGEDLHCVAIRDTKQGGALIGFAPMYRQNYGVGAVRATCLRPFGTGFAQALTEVVQVLSVRERTQEVLRALIQHLEDNAEWNWVQLSLGPQQGWLLPMWLADNSRALITHRNARPCVLLDDLPPDARSLKADLKRNVKESLRRCRNRSAKLGGMEFRCAIDPDDVRQSLGNLISLHRMRSKMPGKPEHRDIFGDAEAQFLLDAAPHLAAEGLARVHTAEHNGRSVAAILVLSDGHTDYISATGLDPDYWELSLNTMLVYQALEESVHRGRTSVNLSSGPDIAKMRWSSHVITFHDFAIVRLNRKSRWLYEAFTHAMLAREVHREARRYRLADPSPVLRRIL